jgi:hypothetical protein
MLDLALLKKNNNIKNIEIGFNKVTKITFIDNLELFISYNDGYFYSFLQEQKLNWGYTFEPNQFYKFEIYDEINRMSNPNSRNISKKFY